MDIFLRHPIMLLLHIKLSSSYVRPTQGTLRCAPLSNMIIIHILEYIVKHIIIALVLGSKA
jgi:hypothetical protein